GERTAIVARGSGFIQGLTCIQVSGGIIVDSVSVSSGDMLKAFLEVPLASSPGPRDISGSNQAPGGGISSLVGRIIVKSPAPLLESVEPNVATSGGSVTIHMRGSGFVPGLTRLELGNGISVDSMAFSGTGTMDAMITILPGTCGGARDVILRNPPPGGGTVCSKGGLLINNAIPSISNLSATSGCRGSTASILVHGEQFVRGATSINLGTGVTVDSIWIYNAGCMLVSLSIGRNAYPGIRDADISNAPPGGGSRVLRGAFEVTNPSPRVSKITPDTVRVGDTTTILIDGSGFFGELTSVDPGGGVLIASVKIDTSGERILVSIVVTADAATGRREIVLSNPSPGGGRASAPLEVVYPVPVATELVPLGANRSQSVLLTIRGKHFVSGATVVSLGADVDVHSVCVRTSEELSCEVTIGAGAALGQRTVVVSNKSPGGGASALTNAFTVANSAPFLSRVTPSTGARGATLTIDIEGMNFTEGSTAIDFGAGVHVDSLKFVSAFRLSAQVSIRDTAAVGARTVVLATSPPGGGEYKLAGGFSVVNPAPTLVSVSPANGCRGRGLLVSLTGSHFESGLTSLEIGSGISVASLTIDSPARLTAVLDIDVRAAPGARPVIVSNRPPGGGSASLAGAFAVLNPSPTLASLTPAACQQGDSLLVEMRGSGFIDALTTCDMGSGIQVRGLQVGSDSLLHAQIIVERSAAPGFREVRISNGPPGGGTAALSQFFHVQPDVPTRVGVTSARENMFALGGIVPTPFNSRARISYNLPAKSHVQLNVYDMLGREVVQLVNSDQGPGDHTVWMESNAMRSGVYVIRIVAECADLRRTFVAAKKMMLMK
ncbi:MAG TPA: T9SS type A sorting domain-containing protein, partial [Bacteroidota bacterium]|nr:T9SS type A sorting domain-containing protein [Bacteroidota bacterium]